MLSTLSIKNYALIDELNVSFGSGFTTITGETGAGKSILLGGLALVIGKRADLSSLRDKDQKCIVEAEFQISKYGLKSFFLANELDFEPNTILRRELLPSGKSRAFINDTPVTLDILSQLGDKLIDVHSQHQTLQLADTDFQLKVIDALAGNEHLLSDYTSQLSIYQNALKELNQLIDFQKDATKEYEYNSFLLNELEQAGLKLGMQEDLEEQYEQLNNVETLIEQVSKGHQLLSDDQIGIINSVTELRQAANKLAAFGNQFSFLNERIQSVLIEIKDIATEFVSFQGHIEANPELLEQIEVKLQLLYNLQKKHNVQDVTDLIAIKEELATKVSAVENIEATITEKKQAVINAENNLSAIAEELSKRRKEVTPKLKRQLQETLALLGMPGASFKIEISPANTFKITGKDNLTFLLSANKGADYGELKKTASGGELSRIMLTIKSILANYEHLPTMMFDEIDTGVSGEISNKMGDIMEGMSKTMQVFAITHLPQVASKGNEHYKVYKEEQGVFTNTKMKKLSEEERVTELAEMLGGKELSESALAHARQLLN